MKNKINNSFGGVKAMGLRLIPNPKNSAQCMDQYGRILEVYTNSEGKKDLRPVGTGSATH